LFTNRLLSFTNRILISKPGAVLQMDWIRSNISNRIVPA
jgi:hypothetical protein